jgi:hypothetical protein
MTIGVIFLSVVFFDCPVTGVLGLIPTALRGATLVKEEGTAPVTEVEGDLELSLDGAPSWRGAGVLLVEGSDIDCRRKAGVLLADSFGIEGNAELFEVSPIVQVFPE